MSTKFIPFTSMRLGRYANATSADTTKYPQTLNGFKTVDLGTPNWTKNESYNTVRFLTPAITDIKPPASNEGIGNIYLAGFTVYSTNSLIGTTSDGVALSSAKQISIRINKYNDLSEAQFKAAMSGIPLLYELAESDGSVWNFVCDTTTKTKNLVDFNETRITSSTWAAADKTKGFEIVADIYGKSVGNSLGTNDNCFGVFVPCKKGESVSLNFFNYEPYYGRCFYCEVDANFKVLTTPVQYSNGTSSLTQKTFTATNDNCIGFAIEWHISAAQTRNYTKENYMVVSGTTVPTAYEPYGNIFGYRNQATGEFVKAFGATGTISSYNKIDFLSVIFKQGKNLYDKNNRIRVVGYFASTGTTWSWASAAYSNKIPCKPNTTYTARYNGNSTQTVLGFGSCSTDDEPSESQTSVTVTQGIRQNSPTINTPVTITTGPNDKWLIVAYNIAEPQHTDMADNLQVEEGSSATSYESFGYKLIQFTNDYYKA